MRIFILTALLSAIPAMAAEIYTFDLLPAGGSIAGSPGSTIGWGYSIENESTSLWLVTAGLDGGVFEHGTPRLLFDFPAIAPGQTVTVPYDPTTSSGLMELTWDTSVPPGFTTSGRFVLSAEWWDGDPLTNGMPVSAAPEHSQFYTAASPVPEPGTGIVVASSVLLLGVTAAFRRRAKSAVH